MNSEALDSLDLVLSHEVLKFTCLLEGSTGAIFLAPSLLSRPDGKTKVWALDAPLRGFFTEMVRLALRLLFRCKRALVLLSSFVNSLKSVTSVSLGPILVTEDLTSE